jgi:PAS domain-containing protein
MKSHRATSLFPSMSCLRQRTNEGRSPARHVRLDVSTAMREAARTPLPPVPAISSSGLRCRAPARSLGPIAAPIISIAACRRARAPSDRASPAARRRRPRRGSSRSSARWPVHTEEFSVRATYAECILDQAADAVIFADRSGKIARWNRASALLFGFSAEEALGKSLDVIVPGHLRAAHWRGLTTPWQTAS